MRPFSEQIFSQNVARGLYKSVIETTDVMGERIFLVDYGDTGLVKQYYHPDLIL